LPGLEEDGHVKTAKRRYGEPSDDQAPGRPRGLPLTLIGYWAGPYAPDWPQATDFVDEHWDKFERDVVASYLDQGLALPWSWRPRGYSSCRFCGQLNGSNEKTDGFYLWPEGLAHYVRRHSVRPPASIIRHIVSMQEGDDWWEEALGSADRDWWKTATLDP
jgi:hypothetical protein